MTRDRELKGDSPIPIKVVILATISIIALLLLCKVIGVTFDE